MSLAGHKFHGPNSCGALVFDKNFKFKPLFNGGGQQGGYVQELSMQLLSPLSV